MLEILIRLVACGAPDPESLRSEPTAATVTFDEADELPADQEIIWTDLEELFPKRPAALPEAISALRPGMDGTQAYAVLEGAHEPGSRLFSELVGETRVVAATLAGTTQVGVTLLLVSRGATLSAIDFSVPDDVAVPMLTTRWGPPDTVEHQDGGAPLYRWNGEIWTATLYGKPGEKAIVKFVAAGAAPGQLPPSTEAMPPESH